MANRFESAYKIKIRDNLGDPELWNQILQDIDLRLAARELDGERIDNAVDQLRGVALQRLNDTFTPVVNEAIQRLASVGAQFTSTSDTVAKIDNNQKTFVLAENTRASFVVSDFVSVRPAGDITRGMVSQVVEYDRKTGLLTFQPVQVTGSGEFSSWQIHVTGAPDLEHSARMDNPHHTTAAQVGAYSTAQVDMLLAPLAPRVSPNLSGTPTAPTAALGTNTDQIATMAALWALRNWLVNGAGPALDQFNELANAIGNDPNFATTMLGQLAKRLRVDAAQSFTAAEIAQAIANLQITDLLLPAGAIVYFPGAPPSGWLKCNGALLSRTTYARLWSYAQTSGQLVTEAAWNAAWWGAFSTGDGVTNFRVPDLRGEFIRVFDDGRGVDTGRGIGGFQLFQVESHTHGLNQTPHYHPMPGTVWYSEAGGTYVPGGGGFPLNNPGGHTTDGSYANLSVVAFGGNETRPRNVAQVAAIKY